MTAPLLLLTQVSTTHAALPEMLDRWPAHATESVCYQDLQEPSIVDLTPLRDFAELDGLLGHRDALHAKLRPMLAGDVRRQVLRFVAAPKPGAGELPDTPYLQLRHVEVKPPVHEQYLAWREQTIFAEVAKADAVEVFHAYHSLLSTEPGVLFLSGFSCAPEEYLSVFASERYAEIAEQAHQRYITENGLYTRLYRRVPAR